MTSRNEHSESREARGRAKAPNRPKSPAKPPESAKPRTWDEVDEASWESFPASDAPASWAGKDQVRQAEEEPTREEEDAARKE